MGWHINWGELAPCRDCTDRHTACHDSCEKYKQFVKQKHETKVKRRMWYEEQGFIYFYGNGEKENNE